MEVLDRGAAGRHGGLRERLVDAVAGGDARELADRGAVGGDEGLRSSRRSICTGGQEGGPGGPAGRSHRSAAGPPAGGFGRGPHCRAWTKEPRPGCDGSRDGAAGGLAVQPTGHPGHGVGDVAAYGRRPVPSGARYAAGDSPEAVSSDGVSVGDVVERVHCGSLGCVWLDLGAARVLRAVRSRDAGGIARGLCDELGRERAVARRSRPSRGWGCCGARHCAGEPTSDGAPRSSDIRTTEVRRVRILFRGRVQPAGTSRPGRRIASSQTARAASRSMPASRRSATQAGPAAGGPPAIAAIPWTALRAELLAGPGEHLAQRLAAADAEQLDVGLRRPRPRRARSARPARRPTAPPGRAASPARRPRRPAAPRGRARAPRARR